MANMTDWPTVRISIQIRDSDCEMFRFPLYNFSLIFAVINLLHDPFHTLLRNNSIEMEKGGEVKGRERWMRRMMNRERERER